MFKVKLTFPPSYPNEPPEMRFETPIWHPNGVLPPSAASRASVRWALLRHLLSGLARHCVLQSTTTAGYASRFCTSPAALRRYRTIRQRQNAGGPFLTSRLSWCRCSLCFQIRILTRPLIWTLRYVPSVCFIRLEFASQCCLPAQIQMRKDAAGFKAKVKTLVEESRKCLPAGFTMPRAAGGGGAAAAGDDGFDWEPDDEDDGSQSGGLLLPPPWSCCGW